MDNFEIAKQLFLDGLKLFEKGAYQEAETKFLKSLEIIPDRVSTLTNLTATQIRLSKYDEAKDSAEKAISQDHTNGDAWLNLGIAENKCNSPNKAIECFDKALLLKPDWVEVLTNKVMALIELKRYEEALEQCDRLIALEPSFVESWFNKGFILNRMGSHDLALDALDEAIKLKPDSAEAWSQKGVSFSSLKRYGEDLACYDQAIKIMPDYAHAWAYKGASLLDQEKYDEAIAHCDQAVRLKPDYARAYYSLGLAYLELKQLAPAIANLERAVELNHENKGKINFILASLKRVDQPSAPPKGFVAELFNEYANRFESHIVDTLKYEAPNILYDDLKEIIGDDQDILDLGCGTGLMGELLKPHAKSIIGVDLAGKILEQAREKNIYDELYQADLNEFLGPKVDDFDLVVALDVFVYLGDLSDTFANAQKALKKGGYFGFTIEGLDKGDFCLNTTLRYSHSAEYCEDLAKNNNFRIVSNKTGVIRQENGTDVTGHYFILNKV